MKHFLVTLVLCLAVTGLGAQTYKQVNDIPYSVKTDNYARERLKLDVYYPEGEKDCPVIVWFHGGGLEGGQKEIPDRLKGKGWVVVGVNYRLLPKVTIRETMDDAAEAVAWVFRHAADYGGDPAKIVVTGHSAGGYIGMLLCLNKAWLAAYDTDADRVMMYVPFSGQAVTHYNVRKMQGLKPLQVTIDEFAPIHWVRPDCPPLVLICGDRELELYGRYDENQYLARLMKLVGHQETYLYELDNHCIRPEECESITRVGTVFYMLDHNDDGDLVDELSSKFTDIYGRSPYSEGQRLEMAKYTPSFHKKVLEYTALNTLEIEYNWRRK